VNERHRFKSAATSADHGLQFLNASEVHQIIKAAAAEFICTVLTTDCLKCIISADRKCFVQRRVTVSVTMSFKYMFNNNNTNTNTNTNTNNRLQYIKCGSQEQSSYFN